MEPNRQLAAASGPLSGAAKRLAAGLDADRDARFVAQQAMRIVFPEQLGDARFCDAILRSSADKVDAMWRIIGGRDPLQATTPLAAFTFAETAAEAGVPVNQFERVYRVGIGLVWLCWYRHALEGAARRDATLEELVGAPTMMIHAYLDGVLTPLIDRLVQTSAERDRSQDHLRNSVLRQAVAGTTDLELTHAEAVLGLSLADEHLAFALAADRAHDVDELVASAQRACGAATAIAYRHQDRTWVVWLTARDGFAPRQLARLRSVLRGTGRPVALGEPRAGLHGLGATGRDALEAARLQKLIGHDAASLVSYADVRLESLFLSEPDRAARFVRDELGALADSDTGLRGLRDTTFVWLTTGSFVSAAAALGVHEHTVRRRIARAERLLEGPLSARRTELLVALRLKRILDGTPARVSCSGAPRARSPR